MLTTEHDVENYSAGPNVSIKQFALVSAYLLGRKAIQSREVPVIGQLLGILLRILSKIYYLYENWALICILVVLVYPNEFLLHQDVLSSEITVDEALLLRHLQSLQDLSHDQRSHILSENSLVLQYPVENGYAMLRLSNNKELIILNRVVY